MFEFIKRLFGAKTPVTTTAAQAPYKVEPQPETVKVEVTKPEVTPTPAVKADTPAKKNRRPRNRKPKAVQNTAPITEGKTKGGNGAVKQPAPAKVAKVKSTKPKNQSK